MCFIFGALTPNLLLFIINSTLKLTISNLALVQTMGSATGLKLRGGGQNIIELESEPKFNINLYKNI